MKLRESIKKILKEESELKTKVENMVKTRGIQFASKMLGDLDNVIKILGLDTNNIDVQEELVKNFIYFTKDVDRDLEVRFIKVSRISKGTVIAPFIVDTRGYAIVSNAASFFDRTVCELINDFFPFKTEPIWEFDRNKSNDTKIFINSVELNEDDD